ncbi:hypothetical protein DAPPUDRAFT_103873 [Daphnia pulex]|uniref:Uncharacterized protein n=1 Tax=Daphnia pulex TaxID=6669 RepID=E9GKM2_DAPPU|nr:hypothetical protein DAPPUDRAFT_103873 [Daphnia pulex]|eukprot:EFX80015.1 hypothetical protein DAPPUDRAFT_103873 [Daphnia pulex]
MNVHATMVEKMDICIESVQTTNPCLATIVSRSTRLETLPHPLVLARDVPQLRRQVRVLLYAVFDRKSTHRLCLSSDDKLEFFFMLSFIETYAANWKKNGGFIVRPPSSLKLLPTKTENRLPTNGRYDHLKQKNDPVAASLHTATQQEGKDFFFLTDFKERKKGKGEKDDSKDTVETFIDEYADEAKRGALYSHETKQEMPFR